MTEITDSGSDSRISDDWMPIIMHEPTVVNTIAVTRVSDGIRKDNVCAGYRQCAVTGMRKL